MNLIRNLYLPLRFFLYFGICMVIMTFGFVFAPLIVVSFVLIALGGFAVISDFVVLFSKKTPVDCSRNVADILSLGDENCIMLDVIRNNPSIVNYKIIEELPFQLQERNFEIKGTFETENNIKHTYIINPKTRGIYAFGKTYVFVQSKMGMVIRRISIKNAQSCKVFPSYIQLKKFEIMALHSANPAFGMKNIRRIGHSYEFDQIKNYVFGDDSRSVNWKASGRKGALMVNQYEDERSQQVLCVIDNSRLMQKPFANMSLLDYAINTSLALSNIILKKHDKAGLVTFSKKIDTFLLPNNGARQLNKIYHSLYNAQTSTFEANYEQLHYAIKTTLTNRSLIFLFTNFDTPENVQDVLPILRKINKNHLLVVVFFEDTELLSATKTEAKTVFDIYEQTIVKKLINEKEQIIIELRKHGIATFKAHANELSMRTITKYFELKSRGLI